jgi:hypothetical protein
LNNYYDFNFTSPQDFVKAAQKLATKTEATAGFIPYHPPWFQNLHYRLLTPEQQKWYFYWRTQLNLDNYLQTDMGYLFLHVYEALNLVGFSTPRQAYERLAALWQHYRTLPVSLYPQIVWEPKDYIAVRIHPVDVYLVDWIADFIRLHALDVDLIDWYTRAVAAGALLTDVHLYVEAWLRTGKSVEAMPLEALLALARYYPQNNKFYQEYHKVYALDEVYTKGVAAVVDMLARGGKRSKSILVRTSRAYPLKRYPLRGAIHTGRLQYMTILELPMRVNHKKIASNLTAIIKYTENIFRDRAGFRAKVRGIELPPEWKTAIDHAFDSGSGRIVIDFEQAARIAKVSEAVRARLVVDEEEASPVAEALPVDAESAHLESNDIPETYRILLSGIRSNSWQASAAALQALLPDYFINVVIDRINEWAYDRFGDILIVQEGDQYEIAEEHRADLIELLEE